LFVSKWHAYDSFMWGVLALYLFCSLIK
jgi:hypothetical protein